MPQSHFLDRFVAECAQAKPAAARVRSVGWEDLIFTLVGFGLRMILPEIKEWVKLGATVITMKRLEIKKRLIDYAIEKELDFPDAEQAAEVIASKLNEGNIEKLVAELEKSPDS